MSIGKDVLRERHATPSVPVSGTINDILAQSHSTRRRDTRGMPYLLRQKNRNTMGERLAFDVHR